MNNDEMAEEVHCTQGFGHPKNKEEQQPGAETGATSANEAGQEGFEEGNLQGRQSIMITPKSDKLHEIKERCFTRLNMQRHNLIRQRRQQSGYGTYGHTSQAKQGYRQSGVFDNPVNQEGLISKGTKLVAQEVDQELLNDRDIMAQIMDEEKEQSLPELSVDEWNEIYEEVTREMNKMLALQLIEDRKMDIEADYQLNQMFSEMAIEIQAETLDPTNNDSYVCALCKSNVARRIRGSRIVCELQGCLDIDLRFDDFRVEDLMIKICQMIDEHKRHAKEANLSCFTRKSCTGLQLVLLDENFEFQALTPQMEVTEKQALALFMECDDCNFLDFMNAF